METLEFDQTVWDMGVERASGTWDDFKTLFRKKGKEFKIKPPFVEVDVKKPEVVRVNVILHQLQINAAPLQLNLHTRSYSEKDVLLRIRSDHASSIAQANAVTF